MSNYSLDTGKKYVKDIFAASSFYNIPEYQRAYVWGKDEIIDLLEDFLQAMHRDPEKEYFLGCMIWNSKPRAINGREHIVHDILDGQQRFLTLYLLHGVLRDLSTDRRLKDKVDDRLRQEQDEYDNIPARNRVHFEIRSDGQFLEKYLLTRDQTSETTLVTAPDASDSNSSANMAQALKIMREWFQQQLESMEKKDFQKFTSNYFSFLSNKVLLLFLATSDSLDDAYNLFTVLNSRGVKLQYGDILRAQNLRAISDVKVRREYACRWIEMENRIGAPYKKLDDFLWAIVSIVMKYRSDQNNKLKHAFQYMHDKKSLLQGKDTVNYLYQYSEHLDRIANDHRPSPTSGYLIPNLKSIAFEFSINSYLPVLLHYRERFGDYRLDECFIKMDNIFSAIWFMGKPKGGTRIHIYLRLIDHLFKTSGGPIGSKLAADRFLEHEALNYSYQDEKGDTAIGFEELMQKVSETPWAEFNGSAINKARYLLLKLDCLKGGMHEPLQFNRKIMSIEPLTNPTWESALAGTNQEDQLLWKGRIGNNILLDRRKDQKIRPLPFSQKAFKLKDDVSHRPHTQDVFARYSSWTFENLKQNHGEIMALLREYYSGNSLATLIKISSQTNLLNSPSNTL